MRIAAPAVVLVGTLSRAVQSFSSTSRRNTLGRRNQRRGHGAGLSGLAMSTLAIWCRVVLSRDFSAPVSPPFIYSPCKRLLQIFDVAVHLDAGPTGPPGMPGIGHNVTVLRHSARKRSGVILRILGICSSHNGKVKTEDNIRISFPNADRRRCRCRTVSLCRSSQV